MTENKNLASDVQGFNKLGKDVAEIEKAFSLLKDLAEACRYVVPKSNALNKAYHAAKKFLAEIEKK